MNPLHTIGDQVTKQLMAHTKICKKAVMGIPGEMLAELGLPDLSETLKRYPF